jgi:hypothetical protein
MADDARISTAFPNHPKTVKLLRRLGEGGPLGLVYLWCWAADNKFDGDLSGMSVEDIEIVSGWKGKTGAFVSELVDVGFLDGAEGRYQLHDWVEHQPYVVDRPNRAKRAALGGQKRSENMTPEERSQSARHAARVKWDKRSTDDASSMRAECVLPTLPVPALPKVKTATTVPHSASPSREGASRKRGTRVPEY